jgi:diphosphomevalonate decarboxylase|tara:strand:- start:7132 stop:8148 length:1017 start_codon:yes stop_codon:yes gene_type:complete
MTHTWSSPSNIALVKYWGKHGQQLPSNPSISFTLSNCRSTTSMSLKEGKGFTVALNGVDKPAFAAKIQTWFDRIDDRLPWLKDHHVTIESSNSFPHSSGIASSASAFSAMALCLLDHARKAGLSTMSSDFIQEASLLARLGSGSASRSVMGGLVVWGVHKGTPGSSDNHAIPYPHEVHPDMMSYQDLVLLVDVGQKSVSSSAGHELMAKHPFAATRFEQAHHNMDALQGILKAGDHWAFIDLIESEALTLHGLMMNSSPSYLLMKPNTLAIIQRIRQFRQEKQVPVGFTLDAGANVHMLYPESLKSTVESFANDQLKSLCKDGRMILDEVGQGPLPLS